MRLSPPSESENNMLSGMRNLSAVVTPQSVINGCMEAASFTGLGHGELLDELEIPARTFVFCVQPCEYVKVSVDLEEALKPARVMSYGTPDHDRVTLGTQDTGDKRAGLCWYFGHPLAGVGVICSSKVPLTAGGGFVTINSHLNDAVEWLEAHKLDYEAINFLGVNAIWVPLSTPDHGVGDGYYGAYIAPETTAQAIDRLTPRA